MNRTISKWVFKQLRDDGSRGYDDCGFFLWYDVGGIYDDRLFVKPVKSAVLLMPNAVYELPYEGAKEMLLVGKDMNLQVML